MRYVAKMMLAVLLLTMCMGCQNSEVQKESKEKVSTETNAEPTLKEKDCDVDGLYSKNSDVNYFDRNLDDEGNLVAWGVAGASNEKTKDYHYKKATYVKEDGSWSIDDIVFKADESNIPLNQPNFMNYINDKLYGMASILDQEQGTITNCYYYDFNEKEKKVNKLPDFEVDNWDNVSSTWMDENRLIITSYDTDDETRQELRLYNAKDGKLIRKTNDIPNTYSVKTDGENIYVISKDKKGIDVYGDNFEKLNTIAFDGQTYDAAIFAMTFSEGNIYVACKEGIFKTDGLQNAKWEEVYKPAATSKYAKIAEYGIDFIWVNNDTDLYVSGWIKGDNGEDGDKSLTLNYSLS